MNLSARKQISEATSKDHLRKNTFAWPGLELNIRRNWWNQRQPTGNTWRSKRLFPRKRNTNDFRRHSASRNLNNVNAQNQHDLSVFTLTEIKMPGNSSVRAWEIWKSSNTLAGSINYCHLLEEQFGRIYKKFKNKYLGQKIHFWNLKRTHKKIKYAPQMLPAAVYVRHQT